MVGEKLAVLFFVVFIAVLEADRQKPKHRKWIVLDDADTCPGREENAFHEIELYKHSRLNTNSFRLKQNLTAVNVTGKLAKCIVSKQESKCEDMPVIEFPGFCEDVLGNGHIWSGLMQNTKPPMPEECPIPAGTYEIKEAPFDLDLIQKMNLDADFVWDLELMFANGESEFACIWFRFSINQTS